MIQGGINRFAYTITNMDAPSASTPGTSVVPGTSNAEGNWTALVTPTRDIYGVLLWVSGGSTASQQKNHLLDLGVDPAGGTSFTAIINNLPCGYSTTANLGGRWFYFPIFIPANGQIAVRIQGNNPTAGTVRVGIVAYGNPTRPEYIRTGRYSETIGTVGVVNTQNSAGVEMTPGSSGAEGAWVSLGTTTRELWWWQLGFQLGNAAISIAEYLVDLAYGTTTDKHFILQNHRVLIPSTGEALTNVAEMNAYCEVPAGSELWVRATCSGSPNVGSNALAIGVGG